MAEQSSLKLQSPLSGVLYIVLAAPSTTFAGGCFWGLQLAFDRVPGVTGSTVGYTAGHDSNPTYDAVCSGRTGHAEAVQVGSFHTSLTSMIEYHRLCQSKR